MLFCFLITEGLSDHAQPSAFFVVAMVHHTHELEMINILYVKFNADYRSGRTKSWRERAFVLSEEESSLFIFVIFVFEENIPEDDFLLNFFEKIQKYCCFY